MRLSPGDYQGWAERFVAKIRKDKTSVAAVMAGAEGYARELRDFECAEEAASVGADANVIRNCATPTSLIARWREQAARDFGPKQKFTDRQVLRFLMSMFHAVAMAQFEEIIREARVQAKKDKRKAKAWREAQEILDAMMQSMQEPTAIVSIGVPPGDEDVSKPAKPFAKLGIPFPLFEGPSNQTDEYCGPDTCSLCGKKRKHCFQLGIGCAVMLDCPKCGATNGLDAEDRKASRCRQCKAKVPFPKLANDEMVTCYACLRAGKAAITKDTELGMISWEEAFEGVTNGVPGLKHRDFEMVKLEDDWVGARLPPEMMFELLRTPTYSTIQSECWQFCCRKPMIFVGAWSRDEFSRRAPDGDGRRLFKKIVQDPVPGLWEDKLHDVTGVYVFRCKSCGKQTAHWDIA